MTRILKERAFSGTTDPKVQPWETEHRKVARRAAAEGIVLLKNEDNLLPLEAGSNVALYGAGAGKAPSKEEQVPEMSMNVKMFPFSRESKTPDFR